MRLPKIYYVYKKMKQIWVRSNHPDRDMYIECLNQSLQEIVDQYMSEFERNLYESA